MAATSKERAMIEKTLLLEGDLVLFEKTDRAGISNKLRDLNIRARANRMVEPEEFLYSSDQSIVYNLTGKTAPEGQFYVVRTK